MTPEVPMSRTVLIFSATALILALVPLGSNLPRAEEQKTTGEEKEKKVRKLLAASGGGDLGKELIDGMMEEFEKSDELPPGFVKKFKELARPEGLVDLIVLIYMKHLQEPEIDAAIAFFQSPQGQKWVKVQPALAKESMEVGRNWGRELGLKTVRALEKDKEGQKKPQKKERGSK